MKALNTNEEQIKRLDELFRFKRETKQEKSLQTWEEENEEYASWYLVLIRRIRSPANQGKPLTGLFLWLI